MTTPTVTDHTQADRLTKDKPMPTDCEACYHCTHCGLPTCRDERPSPREDEHVCPDCAEADGPAL